MRPKTVTFTMAAADADGICTTQTPVGAGSFTLVAALVTSGVAYLAVARHVSFTSDADESADTYTITGTDRNGDALTESISGPNTTTVIGDANFLTVTSITTDGAGTGNITIGSADECETGWIPLEVLNQNHSMFIHESTGADLTWAVEGTMTNPWGTGFTEITAKTVTLFGSDYDGDLAHTTVINESDVVDQAYILDAPMKAVRLVVTDFVSGTLTWDIIPGGGLK